MSPFTILMMITAIILIVVYFMYFSPGLLKQRLLAVKAGPFELSKQETLLTGNDTRPYYEGPDGAFSAFVYLNTFNRTGAYAGCGTDPNKGQASCADGTFGPCQCAADTGDCSTCSHTGYKTIFNIAGVAALEVLTAPDASRQGKAICQLVVKTEGPKLSGTDASITASQKYIETLKLPPIEFQKWTFVTIAREGRRFDVYYNDRIVLSHKTMNMPVSSARNTNYSGVISGADGLGGQIAMINLYNYRLDSKEVATNYKAQADTRGRPYLPETVTLDTLGFVPGMSDAGLGFSFELPKINLCPKGGCFTAPVVQPASPVFEWTMGYA